MVEFSENTDKVQATFTLGLTYFEVMDLLEEQLDSFLAYTPREEIVSWLQWNDRNGVYEDSASLSEFGSIMSKEEGINIMKRQILEP